MKTMLRKTLITLAFALGLTTFAFGEAVETVAYWHKDFANGSVKNGFTMSLGEGTTVNADGTVTLTTQQGGGKPTHGVEISFTDAQGASVFPGYELTVIVKYSDLDFTTSRFPFFATIWGDNKDAKETVLVAKNKNQMFYDLNVTSSTNPSDTAMNTNVVQTIPTSGYMLVCMSGATTGCSGTRIGFASGDGDFLDYGYQSGVKYTSKSFYNIKIGGTVGPIKHFYRPGVKVEGVAIVKGFTTTMRTFRYLFPDECYHFDYADKNPTTETKYLEGLTVKNIKDAVFSAKVATGKSTTWAYGMVSACQKAFTPAEGDPTKVALQYQFRESDYDKSADIYFTDKTDGIYFKKTGGHYNGISGDKLGTDDAKWAKSSSNYSFNDFSVYVPNVIDVNGDADWSQLKYPWGTAPAQDDMVCLNATKAAVVTVDAACAVRELRVSSEEAKLTLKYTDTEKLIDSKSWDFTKATGKVALDCADLEFEGQVVLMSGTIRGYENIDVEGSSLPEDTALVVSGTAVILKSIYTATPVGTVNFSTLEWTPTKPEGGFLADDVLSFVNTKDATVIFDGDLTVGRLIAANTGALTLQTNETTVTIGQYDCSKAEGATTIGYAIGAAAIKAGADTVVESVNAGVITIGEDKTLTVKGGTVSEAKVSNDGTLNFLGGTKESPIVYDSNGGASHDTGNLTIAAESYVKMKSHNQTKVMTVTGAGAETSTLEIYGSGAQHMAEGTQFRDLTLVVKNFTGNNYLWIEQEGAVDETVVLYAQSRAILDNYDFTVGGLRGGGTFIKSSRVLTIKPSDNYEYTGTSSANMTIAASDYTQTLSGTYTGALTVDAGGKTAISKSANPKSIVNNGTLDMDLAATYKLLQGNGGTINLYNNDLIVMVPDSQGTINTLGTGKVFYGYTVTINDCGKFKIPEGKTADEIKLYNVGGEEVAFQVEGDTLTFDWSITGKDCWWDYEFNGNLKSTGADTTALAYELTDPYFNAESNALRVGYSTSYRSVSAYPEEFTAVLYGKIVDQTNHVEMGFGSSGASKISVSLACGDPTAEEVRLVIAEGSTAKKIVSMSVPNAYKADHLYAFVCQTITENEAEKTKVVVYLDGIEWDSYTFDTKITLGAGFQIGSVHGGVPSDCVKADTNDKNAYLDFLRTYNVALNGEAMKRYAEEYPYESENGKATRTFSGETTWVADGWTQKIGEESYATNCPLPSTMIEVTASAAATVEMNLGEQANYESFMAQGAGSLTLGAGGTVEPTVSGLTTIGTDVTVDYNAIKFGKTIVLAGKTLTFDFEDFPISTIFADTSYEVTGAITLGDGAKVEYANLPSSTGRTVTFGLNEYGHYALTITVDKKVPFVYTIDEGEETGVWTWGDDTTDEATVLTWSKASIVKKGTGTQQFVGASKFNYTVEAGTLKFTNNVDSVTSTITVNEDGTFDMNGKKDAKYNFILAGGALVNDGDMIEATQRQMASLTLTDDSTVDCSNSFGMVANSYGANTLNLGGKTLTKTGENMFFLCNTTVTNGTIKVAEGTLRVLNRQVTFTDDAKLELAEGTTLHNTYPLTIGAVTADGATINNGGSITPFTLTGSAILTGNGTWGTNTLDNATVYVGHLRGLAFEGAGTVDVALTNSEIGGDEVTVFTTESANVAIGKVYYNDEDVTAKCTITGGTIVAPLAEAKIGTKYYLTLQEALNVGGNLTLLKNVEKEVTVPAGKTVNLDFGDFAIKTTSRQAINNRGTLTIANGNVTAQESAIVLWGNSVTTISGGTYTANDNAVIAGSGNEGETNVVLNITGGTFNGTIESAGYIACGIYVPNSGTYTISGGQFNITGGCGICARAGEIKVASEATFTLDGSTEPGKVGDSARLVPCVAMFTDYEAGYPGHAETDYLKAQNNALSTYTEQGWFGPDADGYYTLGKISDAEAKIGTKYYLTLKDAFEAAQDKDTVTLCKNFTLNASITNTAKEVTFDMASFTVDSTVVQPITVVSGGELTITGNGTINGPTNGEDYDSKCVICVDGGKLTYLNGTLTATGKGENGMYGVAVFRNGTAYFGKQDVVGGPTITTWFAPIGASNQNPGDEGVEIIVYGGTYTHQATPAERDWWHIFCAAVCAQADGSYDIRGGTFTGTCYSVSTPYANVEQTISFSGGDFEKPIFVGEETGAHPCEEPSRLITKAVEVELALANPEKYCWAGNVALAKIADCEAKIGTTYYLTFAEALEAAQAGETVTLCKDITTAETAAFTIAKNITVDFGTSTITKTVANDWVFQIAKDADVTFTGTTGGIVHYPGVSNPNNPASMIRILGKLTVEGGAYKSDYTIFKVDEDDAATHTAKGELVVNGGTFTIEKQEGTIYTGLTYAVMNWSKATLNGGTFTGDIATLSNDGNAVSKAGETIVGTVDGSPVYKLQVTGSTYENVPKIKGVAIANVTLVQSASIQDELELVEKDEWVTVQKKEEGPTPAPGSQAEVKPVPGEKDTYYVKPTGESKDILLGGVKSGDTLVVDGQAVDSLGVNAAEGVTVVVTTPNAETPTVPYDITAACKGWNGNEFSAELDATKSVKIGEETIPVTPTAIESTEGTVAEGAVATKAIPGLTYTLMRGTEIGEYETPTASAQATTTTISLKDGTATKPADKAFYVIEVTK